MIILDTNVVSEVVHPKGYPGVIAWLDAQAIDTLFLTSTILSELLLGFELLPKGKRKELFSQLLDEFVNLQLQGRVLPFDDAAARAYSTLIARARRNGRAIAPLDGQIAAIAKVHGFTVATRDTGPFEAAGVAFVNPWLG